MTDKKDDKITKAGAVELEENELDQVTGGAGKLKATSVDPGTSKYKITLQNVEIKSFQTGGGGQ
tara:strand:- start:306 stop:497 length:192 start_codon:yes stop_codon:yes gene_type:complete